MKSDVQVQTVTEVTRLIRFALETGFPSLTVEGQLSNVKMHSSGHFYFTLKDEGAQISGVMWRSRVGSLRFTPEEGMKVIASGRISVYEPRGSYQLDTQSMRPVGIGDLQIAFEKLKAKLMQEGLFDQDRKKPLPEFPRRIGIVTSPTGAAIHDIMTVLERRFPALTVIIAPVRVQGSGAAKEIAGAIDDFDVYGDVDLLIVGRGGGSLEDLWPFNEEPVARAIARCSIPIVSAVGHEVDFTIADFVADLRAPTPSVAAELVVRDRREILDSLRDYCYTMRDSIETMLLQHRQNIQHLLASHSFHKPVDLLRQRSQRLDELSRTLTRSVTHAQSLHRAGYDGVRLRIEALNPRLALRRGYTIVRKAGKIQGSAGGVHPADVLDVEFHDGTIRTTAS